MNVQLVRMHNRQMVSCGRICNLETQPNHRTIKYLARDHELPLQG